MRILLALLLLFNTASACKTGEYLEVNIYSTTNDKPLGSIKFKDSEYGLLITPNLTDIPNGMHGFHIHTNPACGNNGKDAGGHYDPTGKHKHSGPYSSDGRIADLPNLYADKNNKVTMQVLAPRVKVKDLQNRSLIIHADIDNYSDHPVKLGGSGARIACGIIKATND